MNLLRLCQLVAFMLLLPVALTCTANTEQGKVSEGNTAASKQLATQAPELAPVAEPALAQKPEQQSVLIQKPEQAQNNEPEPAQQPEQEQIIDQTEQVQVIDQTQATDPVAGQASQPKSIEQVPVEQVVASEQPALIREKPKVSILDIIVPNQVASLHAEAQIKQWLPAQYKSHYTQRLGYVYKENGMSPVWQDETAISDFKQQLGELILADVHPQFAIWGKWLTDDSLESNAKDVILSDAMLGYIYYTKEAKENGAKWLYTKNGYSLADPAEADIDVWLTAVRTNQTVNFIAALVPQNSGYAAMRKAMKAQLTQSNNSKAVLLALNMQRMRLIPEKPGTEIMVNIPDYTLRYYIDGKEALFSKVIVGRPDRKTPIMTNTIMNIVLNPPWNVPPTIAKKDVLPKVKRDPSYLSRNNYTVYNGWGGDAKAINPTSVNWSAVSANKLNYRFKQAAGKSSALGRYKFNMPNSDAIYLHDTPSRGLFSREVRSISSGCVRVYEAATLAKMLLKHMNWDQNKISKVINKGDTLHVAMNQKVPVYLYYMTAWPAADDTIKYRKDIYQYDRDSKNVLPNLPYAKKLID